MTVRTLTVTILAASLVAALIATAVAQSKPAPKPASSWAKTNALVRDQLGTTWQIARVETAGDGLMRVVLRDRSVSQSQYQTMVLTACYHLTQPKAPKAPKEIAFLNVHERTGYVFEAPDRCGEFVKLPIGKKTEIAIAAVTHLF
jgi:hypothetical protein